MIPRPKSRKWRRRRAKKWARRMKAQGYLVIDFTLGLTRVASVFKQAKKAFADFAKSITEHYRIPPELLKSNNYTRASMQAQEIALHEYLRRSKN